MSGTHVPVVSFLTTEYPTHDNNCYHNESYVYYYSNLQKLIIDNIDPCCPNNIIEQAYKIHGIRRCVYSDEDSSDSDGTFPLDDDYEKLKPPPIEIPPEKIVLIEPSPPRERRKKKSKAKKGNKLPQKQSNTEKSKSISKNININNYYYILESDNSDDNSQKFDYQCESSCESMVVEQKNLDLENPTLSNKLEDTNHEDFILIKRNGKKLLPLNQTKEVLHQTLNIDKNKKISHNCTADLKDKTSNKTKNYDSENVCNYSNKNNKFKSANKSKKLVQEIQKPLVKANHVLPKQHKRNRLLSQKDENTNGQQSPKVNSRAVQKTAKVNPSKINLDRGLFYQTNEEHTYSEIIRKNIDKPANMFYSEVTKLNTKTDVFSKKIQSAEKFISKVDKKKEMFYSEVTKLNTKTDLFSKKFQSAEKFISKVDKKKEIKKQINNNNQMLPHRKIKKDKPLTAQSAKKTLNTNFSLLSSIISPHESEVDEMMSVNRVTCNFGDLLPPRINKTIKKKKKGVRHELPAKSAKRLTKINPILECAYPRKTPQCGDNVSLQLKYKESNPLINKQDYVLVPEKRKKIRALKTVANLFSHHLETTGVPQLPQTYESFLLKPIEGESSKPIDEYDILLPPTYEQTLNEQPFKAAKKIAEVDLFTVHSKAQFDPIPLGDEQLMEYKIEKTE
ncbi:hypothetical protein NQ317_005756 [Molorchus minor]|uniref:Uncharacterized protein n=1 Tax=Molorchus minor TaxID=1323400 RepID=A0ABQ9JU56_9CUCU|nr:hypothetical protein NQ317_005756 [Molorchus minor]